MRKRAVALLLVLALVACAAIGLAACNEGGKDGGGAGKKIFTESASLDDVIAALENADSFTLEQKVNYSAVYGEETYFEESDYISTVSRDAVYYTLTSKSEDGIYREDYAKFVEQGEVFSITRSNRTYDETLGGMVVQDKVKNLLINSAPIVDDCIEGLSYYLTEKGGKIVFNTEILDGDEGTYDDPYVRLEGDKLAFGWAYKESDAEGYFSYSYEYVYSKVNATDVVIPEEVKALAYDADWADYVDYNGVSYRKAEDEYGEYYRVYSVQGGAVPEETINGLPVREEGEDPDDPDVELVSYSADSSACRGIITGTLTFVSEKHWIMYIGGSAADFSNNDNWCRGEYYFEGDEGRSLLHISLYGPEDYYFEEFGADEMYNQNDPAYDPSSARLVGNDGEPVEAYGEEVVIAPDANGSYVIRVTVYGVMDQILNAGGTKEDGWFEFVFDTRGGSKF